MSNYLNIENNKILFKEESYAIQGAIFEVYKEIGSGFLEPIYQECLMRELALRKIPFLAQPEMRLSYKGVPLEQVYRPDFVCHDLIILELKATKVLTDDFRAQLFNYLKISKLRLGLLINFGHTPRVEIERIVL
ncbi:MAG: GxxExxY protein [Chloroflexi bacterium HGW-Chloroflexi-5]|nr:MAG: GxxExxY protein [Chloroflexi bacterium HGW-Chloroflexi-5]